MSDHKVPWAPGRYAMVRSYDVWVECVGVPAGEHYDMMGNRSDADLWVSVSDDSARGATIDAYALPGQCPRCYELEGHADGCMVAANLARGVPAFWAPWAMQSMPSMRGVDPLIQLFVVHPSCSVRRASAFVDWDHSEGADNGVPIVALGFDGPTLAPWSALTAPENT